MLECVNKSEYHWSFIHVANDDFMEETCDSDYCLNSENSDSHSGRVNKSGQRQFFIADDAQSTTSDSSCVEDWSAECEEGDHAAEFGGFMSYMNYLQNASDDDLGLPPYLKEDQMQLGFCRNGDLVQTMDLDFDLEVLLKRNDNLSKQAFQFVSQNNFLRRQLRLLKEQSTNLDGSAQLTIFYGGAVNVYDDIPADKVCV